MVVRHHVSLKYTNIFCNRITICLVHVTESCNQKGLVVGVCQQVENLEWEYIKSCWISKQDHGSGLRREVKVRAGIPAGVWTSLDGRQGVRGPETGNEDEERKTGSPSKARSKCRQQSEQGNLKDLHEWGKVMKKNHFWGRVLKHDLQDGGRSVSVCDCDICFHFIQNVST